MSHRAIQRLRRERDGALGPLGNADGDDSDDSEDSESVGKPRQKANVFSAGMFDDSDSDDSQSESSSEEEDEDSNDPNDIDDTLDHSKTRNAIEEGHASAAGTSNDDHEKPLEEDLDALLQEYKLRDEEQRDEPIEASSGNQQILRTKYSVITSEIDARDLDIEAVRRSLFGGTDGGPGASTSSSRRINRQMNVFGAPSDNWPRPPHYVGGGIGMKPYSDIKTDSSASHSLPWPYCDMKEEDSRCPPLSHWFEFVYSDSYQRDYQDWKTIEASGDPNAMVLFVAHHPFVVEALLQLSIVMYQMNQSREGLSFLKRALWVFECAAPNSFLKVTQRCAFMDHRKRGNQTFFSTLFRLIRVSYVGGLTRNSLAIAQLLLSLDPLRDPMNVLLSLDHFALMCNTDSLCRWLVNFVENGSVYLLHRNEHIGDELECPLTDLPNWGFSYALALFNLHKSSSLSEEFSRERADRTLRNAICRFPTIIPQLLEKNEVDIKSRSVQTDWPTAIQFINELIFQFQKRLSEARILDPVVTAHTFQAYETIARIFVLQNFKLWSSYAVTKWLYDNLMVLKDEMRSEDSPLVQPLTPAIIRYEDADPTDYEDKFQTMPADANPFDPNMVALALNIDPNRRRLVQRNPRRDGVDAIDDHGFGFAATRDQSFAGPPNQLIDPDLPLMEVFWRSALPWARVEGVPPPNR